MPPLCLSIEDVCVQTGLGRTRVYQIINAGSLKARKLGKRTLVLHSDLQEFLLGLEVYPAEEKAIEGNK